MLAIWFWVTCSLENSVILTCEAANRIFTHFHYQTALKMSFAGRGVYFISSSLNSKEREENSYLTTFMKRMRSFACLEQKWQSIFPVFSILLQRCCITRPLESFPGLTLSFSYRWTEHDTSCSFRRYQHPTTQESSPRIFFLENLSALCFESSPSLFWCWNLNRSVRASLHNETAKVRAE